MRRKLLWLVSTVLIIISMTFGAPMLTLKAQEPINLQEAIGIAQALYPSAQVIKTEFVKTATPPYYVIGLDNGRSVFINATTKEIIQITAAQAPSVAGVTPPTAPLLPVVPPARGAPPAGAAAASGVLISVEQAIRIAQERFPNTQVLDVDLERKGRRHGFVTAWDVKLSNGYAVYVNAANGAIVEIELMRRPPIAVSNANVAISQAQAEQTAAAAFGGSVLFSRLKQEGRGGGYAIVWEVFLSNGYKVKVDANTGAVVKVDFRR